MQWHQQLEAKTPVMVDPVNSIVLDPIATALYELDQTKAYVGEQVGQRLLQLLLEGPV